MLTLSSVLASLPRLSFLSLGNNRIQDEGFIHLTPGLQQCSQLRILRLTDCGLTSDGPSMALLALVFMCLPHLEEFSFGENPIGDVGLNQLSIGLEECFLLNYLALWDIGLASSQSMSTISHLLQRLHRLVYLDFEWNACGGSSSDWKFCAAVKGHPSLEVLGLPGGLSGDVIRQLESFQNDPTCALKQLEQEWEAELKRVSNVLQQSLVYDVILCWSLWSEIATKLNKNQYMKQICKEIEQWNSTLQGRSANFALHQ